MSKKLTRLTGFFLINYIAQRVMIQFYK